jgi:hypothetical protein
MTTRPPDDRPNEPDPFDVPFGFPIHLRDRSAQRGELTRCGLFASGAPERMTNEFGEVDCYHCKAEGPAAAYVLLPDGRLVGRRSSALANFPFAVAELRETRDGAVWTLGSWQDGIGDAQFALRCQHERGRTAQILPVQFAGAGAR